MAENLDMVSGHQLNSMTILTQTCKCNPYIMCSEHKADKTYKLVIVVAYYAKNIETVLLIP